MMRKVLRRLKRRNEQGQKGAALVLALILLSFGSMVVGGLLQYVDTSVRAAAKAEQRMDARYAADAGIENFVSDLRSGVTYGSGDIGNDLWPGGTVNGKTPVVTLTECTGSVTDMSYTVTSTADNEIVTAEIDSRDNGGDVTITVVHWTV